MEKGQTLYAGKQYEAAAGIFMKGYAQHPYSAFLFNAGVCYQRLGRLDAAIEQFKAYLAADATAPDADKVRQRIAELEDLLQKRASAPPGSVEPPPSTTADEPDAMKSLVVIETEPSGAPVRLFSRTDPKARPFVLDQENPGWLEIVTTRTPANLTLGVGRYHVVVDKFQDFNASHTDIDVSPGHVHHFKANLSQGAFMGYLRVSSNVPGAHIYVDDPGRTKAPWGWAPHGELVVSGKHTVLVEVPGFEPWTGEVTLDHGAQKEIVAKLTRVGWGTLRVDANAATADVTVDGKRVGTWSRGRPPLEVKLAAGSHAVIVESDGRKTFQGEIVVPRGQALPVHAGLVPKFPRGAAWTQSAIGAVFLGAAIYFGLESNSTYEELEADRNAGVLEESDSRVTKGQVFAISSNVGFAVGGVLAALATYNFIRDPLPDSAAKLGAPKEFEDPLAKRPTAQRAVPEASNLRLARRGPSEPGARSRVRHAASKRRETSPSSSITLAPAMGANAGALVLRGQF